MRKWPVNLQNRRLRPRKRNEQSQKAKPKKNGAPRRTGKFAEKDAKRDAARDPNRPLSKKQLRTKRRAEAYRKAKAEAEAAKRAVEVRKKFTFDDSSDDSSSEDDQRKRKGEGRGKVGGARPAQTRGSPPASPTKKSTGRVRTYRKTEEEMVWNMCMVPGSTVERWKQ